MSAIAVERLKYRHREIAAAARKSGALLEALRTILAGSPLSQWPVARSLVASIEGEARAIGDEPC